MLYYVKSHPCSKMYWEIRIFRKIVNGGMALIKMGVHKVAQREHICKLTMLRFAMLLWHKKYPREYQMEQIWKSLNVSWTGEIWSSHNNAPTTPEEFFIVKYLGFKWVSKFFFSWLLSFYTTSLEEKRKIECPQFVPIIVAIKVEVQNWCRLQWKESPC